jgi:hypothetical protein
VHVIPFTISGGLPEHLVVAE